MDEGLVGITASDWAKGIFLSIIASIIGGASKLSIRKSWLIQAEAANQYTYHEEEEGSLSTSNDDLLSNDNTTDEPDNPIIDDNNNNEQIITPPAQAADATDQDEQQQQRRRRPSPVWCYFLRGCGMFGMSVLNPICCVLAMNYASPSILAPFSGLTLVWVILFSPLVNNEQPSSRQILACCFIIAGEVIVAIFGDHTNDEGITVAEVVLSYKKPAFILYFVGLILYLIVMTYWINYSKSYLLRRFAWGCSGGAITGAQNFLKDSLTIVKAVAVDDQQQHLPWIFYVLFLSAASTAFIGLLILTACMKRYDTTYSAASFVGSFVVSASIMAAVHFDTFAGLEGILNYVLYPLGIAVLMIGVYILVRESNESYEEEDESVDQQRRQQDTSSNDEAGFDSEVRTVCVL